MNSLSSLSIYQVGGSLPVAHPTYVKRQADDDFYRELKAGEFCYVLNSRQMGKSSLRVQTMARLQGEGIACAAIDLTEIGTSDIPVEEWYAGIIDSLVNSFHLYETFDLQAWWTQHSLLSPVQKLSKFVENILLKQLAGKIVIFIDEIDSTLKLPFKDDFFALIRAFYNKRTDNPDFYRLTFGLLGVATPADLMKESNRTPFNIGKAIDLKGFQLGEVKPLEKILVGKADNPETVLQEILKWTGGQPFLTQRVCRLVVNSPFSITAESEKELIESLVHSYIIENWESQDEQEHLKTIKNRLLNDEQKAVYLLELYRQILQQEAIEAGQSSENTDLRLSGLVVKREGKLQVYNPIYERVFNESWIDGELAKLRPYAENFRAWIASRKTDSSRLLRGEALEEGEKWAQEKKNLSGEDRDFLAASHSQLREEKIAEKEREAKLEREKKAREAAEEAERIQSEANRKAKRRILIGSIFLGITLLAAGSFGILAWNAQKNLDQIETNIATVTKLSKLGGELQKQGKSEAAKDAFIQAGMSVNIDNNVLKQTLLWSSISLAYQYLGKEKEANKNIKGKCDDDAVCAINKSLSLIESNKNLFSSAEGLPIAFFTYSVQGNLLEETEGTYYTTLSAYEETLKLLKKSPDLGATFLYDTKIYIYEKLYSLLPEHKDRENLSNLAEASLKKHYDFRTKQLIQGLDALLQQKKWKEADETTWLSIVSSAHSQNINSFSYENVSCEALRKIDQQWYDSSGGRFGFRVQMQIYRETGNPIDKYNYRSEALQRFERVVGWIDSAEVYGRRYEDLIWDKKAPQKAPQGHLPSPPWINDMRHQINNRAINWGITYGWYQEDRYGVYSSLFSRCDL